AAGSWTVSATAWRPAARPVKPLQPCGAIMRVVEAAPGRFRRALGPLLPALALLLVSGGVVRGEWWKAEPSSPLTTPPQRPPWTTSRVVGSPDPPPPFVAARAFENLKFEHPLLLARAPGSGRLFVGEQAGVLYSFPDRPDAKADLFLDLRKE